MHKKAQPFKPTRSIRETSLLAKNIGRKIPTGYKHGKKDHIAHCRIKEKIYLIKNEGMKKSLMMDLVRETDSELEELFESSNLKDLDEAQITYLSYQSDCSCEENCMCAISRINDQSSINVILEDKIFILDIINKIKDVEVRREFLTQYVERQNQSKVFSTKLATSSITFLFVIIDKA